MTKKELINRWKSSKGQHVLSEVLSKLSGNKSLETIKALDKHAGRWDLRGATLSTLKIERKIEGESTSLTQKYGTLKLKNVGVESIDFSYADISYSWWEKCRVSNCLFEETKAKELRVYACDFSNCTFRKTNFTYSYLNRNIGKSAGSFKCVDFVECNLKDCIFCFPDIVECLFDNCKMTATDFDGSRFRDCKFIGKIDSAWFNGYSITAQKSLFGIFSRVNPRECPNPMKNVDFSEAELDDVQFQFEIDITNCIFPTEPKYFVVKDLDKVYPKVTSIINNDWEGEERRIALSWIENLFYNKNKHKMKMDLINSQCRVSYFSDDLYDRFFALIKGVNDEVNN